MRELEEASSTEPEKAGKQERKKESNVLQTQKVPGNRPPRKQQEIVPREKDHGKTLGHCSPGSLINLAIFLSWTLPPISRCSWVSKKFWHVPLLQEGQGERDPGTCWSKATPHSLTVSWEYLEESCSLKPAPVTGVAAAAGCPRSRRSLTTPTNQKPWGMRGPTGSLWPASIYFNTLSYTGRSSVPKVLVYPEPARWPYLETESSQL